MSDYETPAGAGRDADRAAPAGYQRRGVPRRVEESAGGQRQGQAADAGRYGGRRTGRGGAVAARDGPQDAAAGITRWERCSVTDVTELIQGVILPPDAWTPEHAASYITEAWQGAVESIVETGRRLIEAKERVGHGNWLPTVELLPFSDTTARRLIQIAEHPDLSNQAHGPDLPASWRTLYVLSQLPAGEIPRRIEAHEITAELQRATAEQMTAAYSVARQEALNAWSQAWDALTAALSYAKTYKPPADTDIYASVDDFTARVAELAAITQTWRNDVGPE